MVSRRKILSRSRDDLNTEQPAMQGEEEDVWYQRDKLYKVRFETGAINHVCYMDVLKTWSLELYDAENFFLCQTDWNARVGLKCMVLSVGV